MSDRSIALPDIKILYGKAAGRCSLSDCRICVILPKTLNDKSAQIGKIAHIVAHSSAGPRGDVSYPADKIDAYDNLILLCSTCHDKVDAQHNTYTVDYLRKQKSEHEAWVISRLSNEMHSVAFAELEIITKGLLSSPDIEAVDFSVIQIRDKINKNGLADGTTQLLTVGMSRAREVEKFISHMSQIDRTFAERLSAGFKKKYVTLRNSGLKGDALFEALFEFASGDKKEFKEKAAGLAVLCHLFVICEVFEK